MSETVRSVEPSDRRAFLNTCSCTLGRLVLLSAVGRAIAACEISEVHAPVSKGALEINVDVSALVRADDWLVTMKRGRDGARIVCIRQADGSFIAMSMLCTHASFRLEAPKDKRMYCPGHRSNFDLQGTPLDGPAVATGPLFRYRTTFDEATKILTITLV